MSWRLTILMTFLCVAAAAQDTDIEWLREINLGRNRELDGMFMLISDATAWITYSIPLLLILYSLFKRKPVLRRKSLVVGITVVASAILANILKYAIDRPRPFITYPFLEKLSSGGSPSFPSGHTTDAFALATALSLAFPRWYIILPSYIWAALVGYSRMHLGVHYPGDVLAGMILGIVTALLCYLSYRMATKQRS